MNGKINPIKKARMALRPFFFAMARQQNADMRKNPKIAKNTISYIVNLFMVIQYLYYSQTTETSSP